MNKALFCLVTLFAHTALYSASRKAVLVEINGQKKSMYGHVVQASLDVANEKQDDPFFNTDVFTYDEKDGKKTLTCVGDIFSIFSDDQQVCRGMLLKDMYVYTPFYMIKRNHSGKYAPFGAIIVGTTDQSVIEHLEMATIRALMQR